MAHTSPFKCACVYFETKPIPGLFCALTWSAAKLFIELRLTFLKILFDQEGQLLCGNTQGGEALAVATALFDKEACLQVRQAGHSGFAGCVP